MQSIAASLGARGEIEVIDDRPPTSIDAETPLVRAVVGAHTEVYDTKPAYGGVPGTTDGTILVRNAHLPVVVYGPGGKWIAHQADEYVEVDDIIRAAKVLPVSRAHATQRRFEPEFSATVQLFVRHRAVLDVR